MGMLLISVLHHYILWHYGRAFGEILHLYKNFFWFIAHFFSLKQLFRSFFAPFKRITAHRGETFSLEDLAGFVVINLISRIIGFILRLIIILIGIATLLLLTIALLLTYTAWVCAPILITGCLFYGIALLF